MIDKIVHNDRYYVYEHYIPNSDIPFYIGKGTDRRSRRDCGRNKWWKNIVNKYGYEIRFVGENLSCIDALWLENMCIVGWGRADKKEGPLVNMTDGGDGRNNGTRTNKERCEVGKRFRLWWKKNKANNPNFMIGKNNSLFGKTGKQSPLYKRVRPKMYKPILTPVGVFESVTAASIAYGCTKTTIQNRCRKLNGYRYISQQYYIKHKNNKIKKIIELPTSRIGKKRSKSFSKKLYKKVKTPLGIFDSVKAAGLVHDCNSGTIRNRCRTIPTEYKYI